MYYPHTVKLCYCRQLYSWTVCHVSYRVTGHGVRAFPVGHSTSIWRLLYIAHGSSSRGLTGCSTCVARINSSPRTAWARWQWWRSTGDSRRTLWFVWWTITRLWCPAGTYKHQSGKPKYYNGQVTTVTLYSSNFDTNCVKQPQPHINHSNGWCSSNPNVMLPVSSWRSNREHKGRQNLIRILAKIHGNHSSCSSSQGSAIKFLGVIWILNTSPFIISLITVNSLNSVIFLL